MIITEDKNIEAFKIKAFILNKEKAGEEHIKATAMLGINYKVMKMPGENKNEAKLKDGKNQDLSVTEEKAGKERIKAICMIVIVKIVAEDENIEAGELVN